MSDIADQSQQTEAILIKQAFDRHKNAVETVVQQTDEAGWPTCLDCGERINKARLSAVPTAARCAECQQDHERRVRR